MVFLAVQVALSQHFLRFCAGLKFNQLHYATSLLLGSSFQSGKSNVKHTNQCKVKEGLSRL